MNLEEHESAQVKFGVGEDTPMDGCEPLLPINARLGLRSIIADIHA
jgi:hypothetical protein